MSQNVWIYPQITGERIVYPNQSLKFVTKVPVDASLGSSLLASAIAVIWISVDFLGYRRFILTYHFLNVKMDDAYTEEILYVVDEIYENQKTDGLPITAK